MTDYRQECQFYRRDLLKALVVSGVLRAGEPPIFRDVAAETALNFRHFNFATGHHYMPEIMGPGMALFDYDNDGYLDIYLIQGTRLDHTGKLLDPPPSGWKPGNRLFKNLLAETGKLHFVDVTEKAGVGHAGYGMGVAVGDYDNDGFLDLYVTNFGPNVLYHNNGDGTFTNVTREAGVDDPHWSTSARPGSTLMAMAGSICLSATTLISPWKAIEVVFRQPGSQITARPRCIAPCLRACFAT
jgi:enediyne biosynthesis protein E4